MSRSSSLTPDLEAKHALPTYNEHILSNFPTFLDQKPPDYVQAIGNKRSSNLGETSNSHNSCQIPALSRFLNAAQTPDPARAYARQLSLQKRQLIEKHLRENFPLVFTMCHLTYLIAVAIAVIVLQAILVVRQADYCYVFNGVWAGLTALALAGTCVILIKIRSYFVFVLVTLSHIVGMVIIFAGLVVVSIFSMSQTNPQNGICIAMLVLGVVTFASCLAYFVVLNGKINPNLRNLYYHSSASSSTVTTSSGSNSHGARDVFVISFHAPRRSQ